MSTTSAQKKAQKKYLQSKVSKGICIQCSKVNDRLDKGNHCNDCFTKRQAYFKGKRVSNRNEAFNHYGKVCVCCGESNQVFLCFDHINNDGAKHRRDDPNAVDLATWLKRYGYPEGFQTLCHNCNVAKKYGICPHTLLLSI